MGFPCNLCSKIYSDSSSYKRHVNSVHLNEKFKCAKCEYQTNRKDVLSKHIMRKHYEPNKRKPETQIESDNKKMKLQDNNDCNDDWRFFENWLNTDHNDQEYEIDMEDVEKFVNNIDIDIDELKNNKMDIQHGKGTEILQHDGFTCTQCDKQFKELKNLNKHIKNVHQEKKLKCKNCNYATNDAPSMRNHVISCDARSKKEIEKAEKLKLHQSQPPADNMNEVPPQDKTADNMNEAPAQDESTTTEKSAFNNLLKEKTWFVRGFQDLLGALQEYKSRIKHAALLSLKREGPQKIEIVSQVRYYKEDKDGNRVSMSAYHNSNVTPYLRVQDFDDIYQSSVAKIWDTFDAFQKTGSGWILERIQKIILNTYKYQPLGASSYIPTPHAIVNKHAIINIRNRSDHSCFEWSVLAALHPVEKHTERTSNYEPFMGQLKSVKAPMTIDDIPKFESANNINISVYTMKHDGKMVYPLYMTKRRNGKDPINLLLITKEDNNHYTYIKSYNRLLGKGGAESQAKVFCPYCCYGYCSNRNGKFNLAEHKPDCKPHGAQRVRYLPEGENKVKFNDYAKMQKAPFCIYADFETLNVKVEDAEDVFVYDDNFDPIDSGMEIRTNHRESGFTFYTVSDYFENNMVTYKGSDAGEVFLKKIFEERIMKIIEDIKPKNLTQNENKNFNQTTICHICEESFLGEDDVKGHKVKITSIKKVIFN